MQHYRINPSFILPPRLLLIIFSIAFYLSASAQKWEMVKEKDGITIYTQVEEGTKLKGYKGESYINAPASRVLDVIENVNNTDWWDKNLTQIKVLQYEKYKRARYYLVYDLPWPVTDRDLCVEVKVETNSATGVSKVKAGPLPGVIPEKPEIIRIKDYHQTWTIEPAGSNRSRVILEGFIDPEGTIPDWVINWLIVDSPVKIIEGLRQKLEKNIPASR